jgi:hypothetical protein
MPASAVALAALALLGTALARPEARTDDARHNGPRRQAPRPAVRPAPRPRPVLLPASAPAPWTAPAPAVRLATPAADAAYRRAVPASADGSLRRFASDPSAIFYTKAERRKLWQGTRRPAPGVDQVFLDCDDGDISTESHKQVPGALPEKVNTVQKWHSNGEFPWDATAGTHGLPGVTTINFLRIPDGQTAKVFREDLKETTGFVGGLTWGFSSRASLRWSYPPGTVSGEVILAEFPGGDRIPFEVRVRTRKADGSWSPKVYRPYPTPESLAAAISRLWPSGAPADAAQLRAHCLSEPAPRRVAFASMFGDRIAHPVDSTGNAARNRIADELLGLVAPLDVLPPVAPEVGRRLLKGAAFAETTGVDWRPGTSAPSASSDGNIVPRGYGGGFFPVATKSCAKCHDSAGKHSFEFWTGTADRYSVYGNVWGDDGVFSFHPFDESGLKGSTRDFAPRVDPRLAALFESAPGRTRTPHPGEPVPNPAAGRLP